MSFKRPTEVSWDSDEDEELLNFNSKFKADDDEDLDEDALLGSDDEDEFTQSSFSSDKKIQLCHTPIHKQQSSDYRAQQGQ